MTAKAAESDPTSYEAESRTSARRPVRPVLLGLVLAPGLLLVGYMVGLGSPWSAHDPTVVKANVEHVPADVPWGLFIHDGDQVQFRLDDVV